MRLITYVHKGSTHIGAVKGEQIVDLTGKLNGGCHTMLELIAKDHLLQAKEIIERSSAHVDLASVTLLPPVPKPEKIWCIGVNYKDRNEEYKDQSALPRYPSLFVRSPTSVVGHNEPIVKPQVSEQLDYEGELVLVIGKPGRHISRDKAWDHIFGMTLCNEGSVRDWLHHGKFNVTQGKNFDRSGSVGPWIVTSDELNPADPHDIRTRVNGELRQEDSTERLMFPFDYLIAYLSTFATLLPGDIIVTGTPTGAGARFDPPRWLKAGDVVEVESSGIGVLRNVIADEGSNAG
jgi:2-keto-4-pentenoate hydratase/2-oxohepta-3-ene-1,7-dioic acid hydratase in catechol pathway